MKQRGDIRFVHSFEDPIPSEMIRNCRLVEATPFTSWRESVKNPTLGDVIGQAPIDSCRTCFEHDCCERDVPY